MNRRRYVNSQVLRDVERQLGQRDRLVARLVSRLSLMSGGQLRQLCFEENANGRSDGQVARRALLRLTRLGVLARLDRRIGGIKGGSDGFVYRLGPVGQRLDRCWSDQPEDRGRVRPEPGARFVDHRLSVSELYVQLATAARQGQVAQPELLEFQAEPDCWRTFIGPTQMPTMLKPDAFVRLGVGAQELWWFVEIDLGTVSQRARAAQAEVYRAYWRSGASGELMPRVLWLGNDQRTVERARIAIGPAGEPVGLFVVGMIADAVELATAIPAEVAS
jgi:hypothetical protein